MRPHEVDTGASRSGRPLQLGQTRGPDPLLARRVPFTDQRPTIRSRNLRPFEHASGVTRYQHDTTQADAVAHNPAAIGSRTQHPQQAHAQQDPSRR